MTNPTPHGQVPEALRLADALEYCDGSVARQAINELRRQHARIAELEAEIAAVGAGGVQALSAAPNGWESVIDEARSGLQDSEPSAFDNSGYRAFAETVLDAVQEGLSALAASPTPPAEQQAALKAAPGEPTQEMIASVMSLVDLETSDPEDHRYDDGSKLAAQICRAVLALAPQQEPLTHDTLYLLRRLLSNQHTLTGSEFRAELEKIVGEAYQQEAQGPAYAQACSLATSLFKKHYASSPNYASGAVVWGLCDTTAGVISQINNMTSCLVQPAPAPLSDDVVKDAARWRWLSEHIGAAWNEGKFTSLVRIVSDKNRAALNASIDRMMAGDWSDAALAAQGGK